MKFTLAFDCDNAAFGDDPRPEVARILGVIARQASNYVVECHPAIIRDVNGNRVGEWSFRPASTSKGI